MNHTKRVILMGGLGNQLFQYSFALSLVRKYDCKVILDPNFAAIRLDETGKPELSKFNLHDNISIAETSRYPRMLTRLVGFGIRLSLQSHKRTNRVLVKILNQTLGVFLSVHFRMKVHPFFANDNGYDHRSSKESYSIYFGYFQSYKFSESPDVKNQLSQINIRNESEGLAIFKEKAKTEQPLVVHIRLTDYKSEKNFGIPTKEYYENAITQLLQTGQYSRIWLFSDEPEEAIELLPMKHLSLVENISSLISLTADTLEVMRLGKGYVIANSSFSWWGAYLSRNSDAPIIYPDPWFSGMPTPRFLTPTSWSPFPR
jgi:hypothetical protein